jgi:hypothetical protein
MLDGPWDCAFWFEVPFALRSKSNFRRSRKESSSQWTSLSSFENSLVPLCRLHRPPSWQMGDSSVPVPARPQVVAFIYARTLLDTANLSKSVLDALETVAFHTDASVRHVACLGERVAKDQSGAVALAQLPAGSSVADVLKAADALSHTCMAELSSPSAK